MSDAPQPLLMHLIELRRRLVYAGIGFFAAFSVCYYFSEGIFQFLVRPLADILAEQKGRRLIYTGLAEAFLTYIKVAAFAGFFLSFPVIAGQVWAFIVPGLYRHERFIGGALILLTPLLFVLGAAFAYFYVCPAAYTFFLSFETPVVEGSGTLPIQLEAKVDTYLSLVIRLILAFGISFELPVLFAVLAKAKIITAQSLKSHWRIAVVLMFALAAFITPPDVLSMIGLAVPLCFLYGMSIGIVRWIERCA